MKTKERLNSAAEIAPLSLTSVSCETDLSDSPLTRTELQSSKTEVFCGCNFKEGYRPRLIEKKLDSLLRLFGALSVEGPKWCGKTWTSLNHAESVIYLGDPANNFQNRQLATLNPAFALEGDRPHLVDEWQEVPSIWDAVRFQVDQEAKKGCFILTGSSTPVRKGILHSGTGRIKKIAMHPMSLFESGDSDGKISLIDLFSKKIEPIATGNVELEKLIGLVVRGGWPAGITLSAEDAAELSKAYLENLAEEEMPRLDGVKYDIRKIKMLLRSLGRNECTIASNKTLVRDIAEFEGETVDSDTISGYLSALQRLFVLNNQEAFSLNLRSSIRVGKSPKRHFADPSLAAAAIGATTQSLFNDLNTFGFLFESLCERDLQIYAECNDGKLFHYRDEKGKEIDAIVELEDGRWGAFEIKLGAAQIDEGAENLLKIKKMLENNGVSRLPEFLCVICGMSNMAYTRSDGVVVVPITSLRE